MTTGTENYSCTRGRNLFFICGFTHAATKYNTAKINTTSPLPEPNSSYCVIRAISHSIYNKSELGHVADDKFNNKIRFYAIVQATAKTMSHRD